ncbi:hypothetical protein [Polyangium mundeleinium]|uniref:HEAT repeat domain-containing protein n=1 Tax=Polyangium mundeleinium TaxID=2995306 RepID=A0ABT5EI66_9BACT|nr:hypothetical protein [Polyangium mundeleinium]MDC0740868.1 hypothetical protein [Polyangium mundeleinium]
MIAFRKMGAAASEALPALIALLSHPSAPLRRELVHAFALIAKGSNEAEAVEQCAAALVQMQNDPDVEVRYEAMCAIRGRVPVREL